jgi:HK97 family phage prohead protease
MKNALKKFGEELATELAARFQSPEFKKLVADTKAASDEDTGTFEVVITSERLDRYNEVIKLDGWQLDDFLENPIVLWMHDHMQPIGVATSLQKQDGKIIAQGKFAPNAKGQEVRQLYDAGIVKAASVGFIPKEQEGNLITKAELLEFSFVSVPANPDALALAMAKSFNINELVTKGIMFVEKDGEETVPESDPAIDNANDNDPAANDNGEEPAPGAYGTPGEDVNDETYPNEKNFSTKQLSPVIASLRSAIVALEALGINAEEPEGDEAAPQQTEEEKQFADFSAKRKLIQDAATVLGDVLAEARQAIEARK